MAAMEMVVPGKKQEIPGKKYVVRNKHRHKIYASHFPVL